MKKPQLSFAKVQWPLDDQLDTVRVTGEKQLAKQVTAAARALVIEDSFHPARAWLVFEDGNTDDPNAIAVYFPTSRGAFHVGYLLKSTARVYRLQMESLGRKGETLEVLGCICISSREERASVMLDLPADFHEFCRQGYHKDPANRPAWLSDISPIRKRLVTCPDGSDFTADELRKMNCWFSRRHGRASLPKFIEKNLTQQHYRESGNFKLMLAEFDFAQR